jgi:hypothetical protein
MSVPQPALNVRVNARSNKPNEKLNTEAISEAVSVGDGKAQKTQTDAPCGTDGVGSTKKALPI